MSVVKIYALPERGIVALTGPHAMTWLDNLVSNDLTALTRTPLMFSALLSPQGKVLFEFFVYRVEDELLLEMPRSQVDGLIKRLRMYKLRARIDLEDQGAKRGVVWGIGAPVDLDVNGPTGPDPRAPGLLWRGIVPGNDMAKYPTEGSYVAERVRLGIAEAPMDYNLGEIFPHEANYDLQNGVSFSKGCFVGQEVVSRMQNKTVVRKRVVRIRASEALTSGADVVAGSAAIGKVGSVAGHDGLALLRLDRAAEAIDKGIAIQVEGRSVNVDDDALRRYRQSVKDRPVIDL